MVIGWVEFGMRMSISASCFINISRPRQNGRHFPNDLFKCIFMNEKFCILIKISLKFVHKGPINNILALVRIMAWRRPGDKPLSEPMMISLMTHICIDRTQWVNYEHSGWSPDLQLRPTFEMRHKDWHSIEEVPYCFSRSSIKFQGHTGWKIHHSYSNMSKITRPVAAIKSLKFAFFGLRNLFTRTVMVLFEKVANCHKMWW